jgi:hypothetical protein
MRQARNSLAGERDKGRSNFSVSPADETIEFCNTIHPRADFKAAARHFASRAKRRLPSLGANIRLRLLEQVIERADGRIEHQVLSIPRFILSVHYLIPRW